MDLWLAGFTVGFFLTMAVMFIIDELRFVPRRALLAVCNGFGLALILQSGPNTVTVNYLGIFAFIGSAVLFLKSKKPRGEK